MVKEDKFIRVKENTFIIKEEEANIAFYFEFKKNENWNFFVYFFIKFETNYN